MKRICSLAAVLLTLGIALGGCSGSDELSSSNADTGSSADIISTVEITEDGLSKLGDRLRPIAELCAKKHYTLECTLTGTDIADPIRIKRVVNGEDVYQLQTERLGSHGFVSLGGVGYDFDYVCGMYREARAVLELNIIEQIAANGLAVSKYRGLSDEDGKQYDVEEYVYTGGTYITRIDFFFEKADGRLVRYVTTYSVEGQDDIVETRTVERLDGNVDESLFNAYFADELADFENMSEEQRQGFCQGLCGSYGITPEEMSENGVSLSGLKNIDYNTLFRLIYNYGEPHEAVGDDSSEEGSDSSESADSDSTDDTDSTDNTDSTESTDSTENTDDTEGSESAADGSEDNNES